MLTPEIKTKIHQLWDKFWSNSISTRINVIEQISYLVFIRWLEDTDNNYLRRAKTASLPYSSLFEGTYTINNSSILLQHMRWSHLRQMTDKEALLEHVATVVFPWLKTLSHEDYPFSRQMSGASFLIPNSTLLDEAIRLLDSISLEIENQLQEVPSLQDTLGDVYEYLLHDISATTTDASPGIPAHIFDLMCELARPVMGDAIGDPCCGMGDLLVHAGQRILKDHTSPQYFFTDSNGFEKGSRGDLVTSEEISRRFERDMFTGFEKDGAQLRLATMNLMLHGVDRPLMSRAYAPPQPDQPGGYTLVLSNPANTEETVYMQQIMEMLAPGGRAVLLVSHSLLAATHGSYPALRQSLFDACEVQAVIQFSPANLLLSSIGKEAVLVIRKGTDPVAKGQPNEVWFHNVLSDGYSYPPDGPPEKLAQNPLPEIAAAFHRRRIPLLLSPGVALPSQSFWRSTTEIAGTGYNLDIRQPQPINIPSLLGTIGSALAGAIGAASGAAIGNFVGKVIETKGPQIIDQLTGILKKFKEQQQGQPLSVVHQFIKVYYGGNPFTFRQLHTALLTQDPSMTFEQVHQEVWAMLKPDNPVLRQVYYDARMANTYATAYHFLRKKKAENGIYLLYTAETVKTEEHETAVP